MRARSAAPSPASPRRRRTLAIPGDITITPGTLREKQSLFVLLVAELIQHATRRGYALTFSDAYRSPEEAARLAGAGKGIAKSLHTQRLAIDLNLFKDGKFLSTTSAHEPLGVWWEALHPLCRWGGRFKDGNHYSLTHEGRA